MSILEPPSTSPRTPESPAGVQPGGGHCVQLELLWGRVRRGWLRRFRPGYVERMKQLRQGSCPGCTHDVVDARDLKWCRNVCGYRFPGEDERLHTPGAIRLARAGRIEILLFSLLFLALTLLVVLGAVVLHPAWWLLLPGVLFLWFEAVYFFRDPERRIPVEADALVSPADGRVTHIEEVDEPDFPGGRAFRISIFLSVFNVHINRAPRSGRVVGVRYFRGCYLDARHADCAVRNEQLWLDLQELGTGRLVRVKQIAGAIARRIVCWVRLNEEVRAGDRFGMIKFGSRTDVLIPAGEAIDVLVKVGERVYGGSTVLLQFREQAGG